jgi:lysophospholipase L1-like esterase
MLNFGFSGNGRMELEVGRFLTELDPAVFLIDCLPNMSPAQVAERTGPLVQQLREKHEETPILLVEDRSFGNAWFVPGRADEHVRRRQALRDAFAALQQDGVAGLHLLHGEDLLGSDDEGTTDGSHPNDLGMMRQAERVAAALQPLLPR